MYQAKGFMSANIIIVNDVGREPVIDHGFRHETMKKGENGRKTRFSRTLAAVTG